jgi:hypothetical protein
MSAPFRIRHPESGFHEVAGTDQPIRDYFERLMKTIPGEVVGLYIVGSGLIPREKPHVLVFWTALCLFGVIALRAWGTADTSRQLGPQWPAVLISSISFVIWVYSMGGPFTAYGLAEPYIGSLLVLAWTFFVPIFYKGSFD